MYMTVIYRFRASTLNTEGYYFFGILGNKPYTKFVTYNFGVLAAFFYMELLSYRKIQAIEEKRARHPIIHALHENCWFANGLLLVALFMVLISFTTQWASNYNAY